MARIRTIKPEFPHSESMGRVSRDARLAFVLLWTLADDSGRLRGNSRMLASLLFPYDDDAPKLMDEWLKELDCEKCINRYQVDGQSYIEICNWLNHQKIDKPTPSKIPAFVESSRILANPPESVEKISLGVDQGVDQGKDHSEPFRPREYLLGLGVDKQVVDDWLQLRKQKRAKVTLTAIEGIQREAAAAFLPIEDVLRLCCRNGWQGFNASWLKGQIEYKTALDKIEETGNALTGKAPRVGQERIIEVDGTTFQPIAGFLR